MTTKQRKLLASLWQRSESAYDRMKTLTPGWPTFSPQTAAARQAMDQHLELYERYLELAHQLGEYHDGEAVPPLPTTED